MKLQHCITAQRRLRKHGLRAAATYLREAGVSVEAAVWVLLQAPRFTTPAEPCRCGAYRFPHRISSGRCPN